MTTLFRLAVLVLALVVGVAPATALAYVELPNAASDAHYVFRAVGAAGLTSGEYTVTWQQWIIADRAAQFQTYYSVGPTPFLGGETFDVAFDGDGAVSNNMAVATNGSGDVYGTVLPVVGAWKNMALRVVDTGGSLLQATFYYDLAAGTGNNIVSNISALPRAWDATTQIVFSNNQWAADAEGTNGRYRCAKLWERLLTVADTQTEAASCEVQTSATSLFAQWKLCTDLLDSSGNGRTLSAFGTNSFVSDDACGTPGYILTEAGDCINTESSNRLIKEAGAGIGPCVASAGRFRTLMGVGQ